MTSRSVLLQNVLVYALDINPVDEKRLARTFLYFLFAIYFKPFLAWIKQN